MIILLVQVIPDVGLCISVFDILKVEDGIVSAGEGFVRHQTLLRMLVFKPHAGEVIIGKITRSNGDGVCGTSSWSRSLVPSHRLSASLGFFNDIFIPSALLRENTY